MHGQMDVIAPQFEDIRDFATLIDTVRRIDLDDSRPEQVTILARSTLLLAAMIDFIRCSLVYLKTNFFKAAGEIAIGMDALGDSHKTLKNAATNFEAALNAAANVAILERQEKEERERTLKDLSEITFSEKQRDLRDRRLPNTAQWVLADPTFKEWWDGKNSLLWCYGDRKTFATTGRHL